METKFWIGVVSKAHVAGAVEGGFVQLNHGKKAPLSKLKAGDWLVYYSPRRSLESREPCQKFTAIGRVKTGEIYQYDASDDFKPYRVAVDYLPCQDAAISELLDQLSFTRDKQNWGQQFRRGYFEISQGDFELITEAMGASVEGDALAA